MSKLFPTHSVEDAPGRPYPGYCEGCKGDGASCITHTIIHGREVPTTTRRTVRDIRWTGTAYMCATCRQFRMHQFMAQPVAPAWAEKRRAA